jgi:Flp pilus assembly protein TadG
MRPISRARRDGGMATAELAACLPVLAILLLAGLAAISVVDQQGRAQDAASEIARAAARGDTGAASRLLSQTAPRGSTVTITTADGLVTATVTVRLRPFDGAMGSYAVTERAVAAQEPATAQGTAPVR